jgi:hypothetical protein
VSEKTRRASVSVQVEVEVPGTPEEVWAAIATGPGVSSWFMPADVDSHVGGTGPRILAPAWIRWRRFYCVGIPPCIGLRPERGRSWVLNAPTLRDRMDRRKRGRVGTCVSPAWCTVCSARDKDDWTISSPAIDIRLADLLPRPGMYRTHFSGRPCSAIHLVGFAPGRQPEGLKARMRFAWGERPSACRLSAGRATERGSRRHLRRLWESRLARVRTINSLSFGWSSLVPGIASLISGSGMGESGPASRSRSISMVKQAGRRR